MTNGNGRSCRLHWDETTIHAPRDAGNGDNTSIETDMDEAKEAQGLSAVRFASGTEDTGEKQSGEGVEKLDSMDTDSAKAPPERGPTMVALHNRSRSGFLNVSNADKNIDFNVFKQKREDSWSHTGVRVGTNNLSYAVIPRKKGLSLLNCGKAPPRKTLLRHITLVIEPGEVTYVMGPSGAGKSTLLDILAGRVKSGIMSGNVYFNGKPRAEDFYENSAYVRQDDVHIATLTVGETLRYAARLRIGDEYTDQEREARVRAVADLLDIENVFDSIVGDGSIRGISGGQKKRLSIAVEILHMPSLIFLDEPTSGLDSVMSYEVMSFARELSRQRRTLIATVHQPSVETLGLSNKVIVVVAGRLAYSGPTEDIVAYFSSPELGFSSEGYSNPADFMLAAVSGTITSSTHRRDADPHMFSDVFNKSEYYQSPDVTHPGKGEVHHPPRFPTPIWKQTLTLLERFWVTQSRQHFLTAVTIGKNVAVAIVFGAIFYGQGRIPKTAGDAASGFNMSSLLYFAILYMVIAVMQIMPQTTFYKVLYSREREANAYSTFAYWATHAVINIPLLLVAHVACVEILYWLIMLPPNVGAHFFAVFVTFLVHLCALYLAQFVAAVTPSAAIALSVFPLLFLFMLSFTGFAIPLDTFPKAWTWVTYICYPRWGYESLMHSQFRLRPDYHEVMTYFGLGKFSQWECIWILLAYMVVLNVFVYWGLLPPKSKLRCEDAPPDTPHSNKAVVITMTASTAALQLEDYKQKSVNRIPGTVGRGLLFKDVEYSVGPNPQKAKRLLKGISGKIDPGEMCAIMGGSGAGKSTLLDVLAFRKTGGHTAGDYFIGQKAERPMDKWNSYVTQDNVHIAVFTVRETLRFAAHLRLPEGLSTTIRNKRAADVMHMLGLDDVADVIVGNESMKGISGGQVRRLSIGVEVMQLPDVIFLDEPTTGLDSTISHEVMAAVRNVANHNRTVVCTIHSPSHQVFDLFDKLILLALGRQTYYGTTDEAVAYFTQPSFGYTMPPNKNPADFIMEASQGMLGGVAGGKRMSIRDLNAAFLASANYREIAEAVDSLKRDAETSTTSSKSEKGIWEQHVVGFVDWFKPVGPRNVLSQIVVLGWRQIYKLSKMRAMVAVNILKAVVVGLFHGCVYYQLAPDALQSRLSLLFFAMMYTMIANQSFIPEVYADRLLLYRERGAGVYGSFPFWVSSSAPFIPQALLSAFAYCVIMYHMTGLHAGADHWGYFTVNILITTLCGLFFCQFISFCVPTHAVSVAIFPAALFILVAFCGFVVRISSLPKWLQWGPVVAFPRWSFEGLFVNEFLGNRKVIFGGFGFQPTPYSDAVYDYFAKLFNFGDYNKWDSIPILILSAAVLWVACYFPIRFVSFEKR